MRYTPPRDDNAADRHILTSAGIPGQEAFMKITNAAGNSAVPPEWILEAVSLDEIEGSDRAPDLIKPADCPEWKSFKSRIEARDELRYFTAPQEAFVHGVGRMGYVIMRNGKQVDNFVVFMT